MNISPGNFPKYGILLENRIKIPKTTTIRPKRIINLPKSCISRYYKFWLQWESNCIRDLFSRSELPTTEIELAAIAKAAKAGLRRR